MELRYVIWRAVERLAFLGLAAVAALSGMVAVTAAVVLLFSSSAAVLIWTVEGTAGGAASVAWRAAQASLVLALPGAAALLWAWLRPAVWKGHIE